MRSGSKRPAPSSRRPRPASTPARRACNTEGAIAKYLASESGNAAAEASHPGIRRLRLHPRVPGREDQARRAHHDDLRGHLRDPGDDDRPRPLAAAPQDARRALPRAGPRARAAGGRVAGVRRRHRALWRASSLAEVLESARIGRLTRHQHVLLQARRADRRTPRPLAAFARRAARGTGRNAATRRPTAVRAGGARGHEPGLRPRGGAEGRHGRRPAAARYAAALRRSCPARSPRACAWTAIEQPRRA